MMHIPEDITMIVLDMDGTIYRKPRMVRHMLRKQWRHLPSLIAERRWRMKQRKALRERRELPSMPVGERWYSQSYLPAMVDIIRKHYTAAEWVRPLIAECKQRGIKVVILSDYEAVEDKLKALGLETELFDAIVASGDHGTIKPDVRLGTILAEKLHAAISWQHVLFIGDRYDTEGELARALGAQFLKV